MAQRGFLAEMNRQVRASQRRAEQRQRQWYREQAAAQRQVERAQREAERAAAVAQRADAKSRMAAEREAKRLYAESRLAEAEALNSELTAAYAEIDGILQATLDVDDWVDLDALNPSPVEHPPFAAADLEHPIPAPRAPDYPPQPVWEEPGLSGLARFGGKKHREKVFAQARADYEAMAEAWHEEALRMHAEHVQALERHQKREQQRCEALAEARETYARECRAREAETRNLNEQVDRLVTDLAFDVKWAVEEYVRIVLANSVYPDVFPVEHLHEFDLVNRELTLTVLIPPPEGIPEVKTYRYTKSTDEITATALSLKDRKRRYTAAVHQVALRTIHEVFEADRHGKIKLLSLSVVVDHLDPATGNIVRVPLVAVAADRDSFLEFDLARVEPAATLQHLGATVSKSPYDVLPADISRGVRMRST